MQFLSFFCILSSLMYVRGFCTACFCSCMFSQTQITDKIRENQARKQGVRIKKEKDVRAYFKVQRNGRVHLGNEEAYLWHQARK